MTRVKEELNSNRTNQLSRIHTSLDRSDSVIPSMQGFFFLINPKGEYQKIKVDQILWIEATRGGLVIQTEHSSYVASNSLRSFQKKIWHPHLIQGHRSFLVNWTKVEKFKQKVVYIPYQNKYKMLYCSDSHWEKLEKIFFILKSD